MKLRNWLSALGGMALVAAAASSGCGQSVATCDSICQLPMANLEENCATTCAAKQSACTTTSCSATFQDFLTCVGNAGTYEAVDGDCAELATSVDVSQIPRDGGPPVDASSGSPDARHDAGVCGNATCAVVCAKEDSDATCLSQCEDEQVECSGAATAFQGLLTCVCEHPTTSMGPINDACITQAETLVAGCPALGPVLGIDAGVAHP